MGCVGCTHESLSICVPVVAAAILRMDGDEGKMREQFLPYFCLTELCICLCFAILCMLCYVCFVVLCMKPTISSQPNVLSQTRRDINSTPSLSPIPS